MTGIGARLGRAFAHNDYAQARPLLDALEHGFAAVEADVWLVDGELLVGHGRRDLTADRTLAGTYLDPLAALVARHGRVYDDGPLVLLVDVKSEAGPTWEALAAALRPHRAMLAQHRRDGVLSGPVSVIVSGHLDLPAMEADPLSLAGADGRLGDLVDGLSPVVTMVSAKWSSVFGWRGEGPMPADERAGLRRLVAAAHRQGRMIRFWGTTQAMWDELVAADVDLVLGDDLPGMAEWFSATPGGRREV